MLAIWIALCRIWPHSLSTAAKIFSALETSCFVCSSVSASNLCRVSALPAACPSSKAVRQASASLRSQSSRSFCAAVASEISDPLDETSNIRSKRYGAASAMRPLVNQLFVATRLGNDDFTLGGKLFRLADHGCLSLVHILETHRPHDLDIVAQQFSGAFRHVRIEEFADLVVGPFHGKLQHILIDVSQQRLYAGPVELQ